ncbi:PAS domain S-box-containing protein [Catalinimonas alkaloidigena]|uniref:PAS domain S-box protein n=1 Tax=Catalinimonas alkaloidigena TaxID=1075417 RepID=UPI002404A4E8|nr:PAS domain S-box protein [Catalinimonas alkaloidigena]MDF9801155.1 PAS domain S-box-containing protein [Catalinimonas alkaloidigena]
MPNSSELINTCLNAVDSGICVIDQHGNIKLANAAFAALCEISLDKISNSTYESILPQEKSGALLIEELIQGTRNELEECKTWWNTPELYKFVRGHAQDTVGDFGKGRIILLKDISKEVHQRQQLQYQSIILGNVQDSVIVTDSRGVITYWNDAATELFGYTRQEMVGGNINKLNPAFNVDDFITKAGGKKDYYRRRDWQYTRRDGKEVWADVKLSMLYDENGSDFIGFIGVSKDITEKKRQEQELVRRNKELASLIESQTNFLARVDLEGHYIFVNKHFLESFDYDESIIGKHFSSEIHPDDIEKCREGIRRCMAYPGVAVPIEIRRPKGDGSYITNYWEFTGITNEEGEVVELQGIGYDITERKRTENKVHYLKTFNELLLEISTGLVNLKYQNLGAHIIEALGDVTEFTGFDRAMMYLFNEDTSESELQYEYCAAGIPSSPPESHKYPAGPFVWWKEKIMNLEAVEISNKEGLPAEAKNTRREMEAYGVNAMISVPVAYEQEVMGFLVFLSMKKDKCWDYDAVTLLKLLGSILANTLYRARTVLDLEESRNRYRLLADNVTDMLIKHDLDFNITFATPSSKEMIGYLPEELIGSSFAELVYPEDHYKIMNHVQEALDGNLIRFITRLKKKSGAYLWVEASARAFDNNGKTELVAVIRDIHTQKLIEIEKTELFRETHTLNEELRASEEELRQTLDKTVELNEQLANNERKFKGLIEKSFDGIVVYGPDSSIKYISSSATQIIGYTQEEALKMSGRDFIYPADLPAADEKMSSLIQKPGERVSFEVRSTRKDGKVIWIETHITNLLGDPAIQGLVANFRDITDRKKAAIELEEIRMSLNVAQKIAKIGSWELELPAMKSYMSEEFYNLLGLQRDETQKSALNFVEFVHPDDKERIQTAIDLMMQAQKVTDLEFRIIDKKGRLKYVRAQNRLVTDGHGKAVRILGTIQDITKETELERLLEETSRLAKVGGWEVNVITNELIWTEETYAVHEVPYGEELELEKGIEFYHPEDRPVVEEALKKMTSTGIKYDLELRIITSKGNLKWVRTTGGIVTQVNGKVIKIRGSIQDITERKLREEEVKKYSERLRLAAESAQIGVWDMDIQQDILRWDRQTCKIFGVSEKHVQASLEKLRTLLYPEDRDRIPDIETLKSMQGDSINLQFRIIKADSKEIRHIKSSAKVLFDNEQNAVRMIGIHWDITALKENEERLQKNNEELRKTNTELDYFVYSTSHNLRAPLTSVMGIVDVLRDARSEAEKGQFIDLIRKSIYKLDETIQEINDYSKNSRVEVQKVPIDFRQMINTIAESLSFMDNARKVKLDLKYPEELEFYSDTGRLKIIFNNLLSNAIKYSNPAEEDPIISVNVESLEEGVLIEIKDNGIGIKKEYLDKIFNMFFRATNRSSGSGLGLYIVKEAVEKLGGDINVKSAPGKGTDFKIQLPNLK